MASINEILGKNIDSVKALKAEIKSLQDSLVGLDAESQEFKDTTAKLTAAQDELNKVTKAGKEENNAAKDSIVGMKNEYKALYDQYKLLSDEQRNSDFGKNMAASLETLSSKINETQKGVGSFKDNIGNYAASVSEAFNKMGVSVGSLQGPFKAAQTASGGLNIAFKTLAANPIMLAITAIVAILAKAAAAIKNNEQLTMRLQQALSVFKPVLDAVSNAFDFLAGMIVKVVEGFAKVSEKVLSVIPGMKKAIDSHKELAKATNDLTKAQRENSVVLSQKQSEVEALRAEAAAATDNAEKLQLLEEAKAKQAEIDQTNLELAQEDLRIKEALAEKTPNDTQAEEELAAARKKVNDITAEASRHEKEYNRQITTTTQAINNQTNSTNNSTVVVKNYREEAKKLYEQLVEDSKDEVTKLTEKYEKEKKLLEKYHYDTTLLTKKYNTDINSILKEQTENRRQTLLAGFKQERNDYENQLNLLRQSGDAWFASAAEAGKIGKEIIPVVQSIQSEVDKILNSAVDDSVKKEIENILNTEGFASLGEDFDGLKNLIDEVNAKYGLSIRTLNNLKTTFGELTEQQKKLLGENQIEIYTRYVSDAMLKTYESYAQMLKNIGEETGNIFKEPTWIMDSIREMMLESEYSHLEFQKQILEKDLENFQGTQDQKLQILQEYYAVVEEMEERHRELSELNQQRTAEMVENLIDAADQMGSALGTWKQTRESVIDSELKAGKISEQEATKQKKRLLTLERLERDFAIATIIADAASGAFSIWKGYATEVGVINAQTAAAAGPGAAVAKAALDAKSLVSAIAKTAGLAATATAQIAAAQGKYVTAKNNMSAESGGGGSVGVAAAPMLIDSAPVTWTQQVQNTPVEDEFNKVNLWVSVSEIDEALNHKVAVSEESSF